MESLSNNTDKTSRHKATILEVAARMDKMRKMQGKMKAAQDKMSTQQEKMLSQMENMSTNMAGMPELLEFVRRQS